MRRPYKVAQTPVGERLEQAIQQMWGSHRALAEHTGIKEGTISKYVQQGRLPAGQIMVKLAQALPGQIDYILTGRRPTDLDQQQVGSLPPKLREILTGTEHLSSSDQDTVSSLAYILGKQQRNPKLVRDLIQHIEGVALAMGGDGEGRDAPHHRVSKTTQDIQQKADA